MAQLAALLCACIQPTIKTKCCDAAAEAPAALRDGSAILFLHLLGLDSQSHAHGGPHAQAYLDNIELVDRSVADLVQRLERLFPDEQTTYLLTSDHGCAAAYGNWFEKW